MIKPKFNINNDVWYKIVTDNSITIKRGKIMEITVLGFVQVGH